MTGKIKALFCLGLLFVLADLFLCYRYASWGSGPSELVPFIAFTIIAEALILFSICRLDNIINPFTIYSIFIYIAGFSFIFLSDKQQAFSPLFIVLVTLSILSFIAGGLAALRTYKFSFENIIPSFSKELSFMFLLLVFIISIGVFFLEISQLGYIPLLNLANAGIYDDLTQNEVTPLHNFIVLNSVLPAMFYITYKRGLIPFYLFLLLTFGSVFIIVNFFSRQIIVLFFFSMLLAVAYYRNISFTKLFGIGFTCIILFIVLGEIRSSTSEEVSSTSINAFLKEYAEIKKPTNIIETYMSLYGGVNFSTGNKITELATHDGYLSYGAYTFRPVFSVLPIETSNIYPLQYSSYSNLGTYVTDPYLDFRWPGVILLNLLYGFLAMNSFKNYNEKKSPYYIVEWSLFMFCIFMCSFTNFFHLFFIVFFFIINRLAIK